MHIGIKASLLVASLLVASTAGALACDNESLDGKYAFKAQGATVGVFDSGGALHPFAAPQLIDSVGQFTFTGHGSLTRVDYAIGNGVPQIGPTTPLTPSGFRTGQTGTYSVADDCTGNLVLNVQGVTKLTIAFAVIGDGRGAYGIIKTEHVPGLPPAIVPPGTTCTGGCDVGVNVLLDLRKDDWR